VAALLSLLPLEPRSTEPDESDEPLELSPDVVPVVLVVLELLVVLDAVSAEDALAIAATPSEPLTLSATRVPVATASRRRPCSLLMLMGKASAPSL
jgi:hypothetical protein